MGLTLHVAPTSVVNVTAGGSIQDAIDDVNTPSGALILVPSGVYRQNTIMWKNVTLQGYGAASTIIDASHFPAQRMVTWRSKLQSLIDAGSIELLTGQDPTFSDGDGPGILVAAETGEFGPGSPARIDGFTIMSADTGGAIFASAHCSYLQITNNKLINNGSNYGGGVPHRSSQPCQRSRRRLLERR